jgi:hypothetical protein
MTTSVEPSASSICVERLSAIALPNPGASPQKPVRFSSRGGYSGEIMDEVWSTRPLAIESEARRFGPAGAYGFLTIRPSIIR